MIRSAQSGGVLKGNRPKSLATKGFGFIQPDDGGADVFVHISAVERAGLRGLNDGQKITFELVKDRKSGKISADSPLARKPASTSAGMPWPGASARLTGSQRCWATNLRRSTSGAGQGRGDASRQ